MIDIDLTIIGVFLVITLAVGLYYGRGITTFKDYAVGSKRMSTFVLTISLAATIYGGNVLSINLNSYYREGLYALIMSLSVPVGIYLTSRFIIVRMKECMGDLSIAESMGKLYGPAIRVVTAIFGIILTIAILAAQFKVGLDILLQASPLFKIVLNPTYYVIALALLVILYSTFGGARAVALTDVYQFFLFSICFPIVIFFILYHGKNRWENWQTFISLPRFNPFKECIWDHLLAGIIAWSINYTVCTFNPDQIQRLYMSASIQQAAKVFSKSIVIRTIIPLLFFTVIIALYIGGHRIPPHQSVLDYIISLTYFPGMKGLLLTTIIALLMSTADSNLHISSVLFTNELWTLMPTTYSDQKPSLKAVRITSALIGIISLLVTLYTTSIAQLLNKTVYFYAPAVSVPFIMAYIGFRPRAAAVLVTIGVTTALTAYRIFIQGQMIGQQDIFNSLLYSAFILLITHYLLPKKLNTGWIGIKDTSPWTVANQETKRWWLGKLQQFQLLFTQRYWENIFPKKVSTFIATGLYCMISSAIALFYMQKIYNFTYIYWYIAVMAIGTIIAFYPAFHSYKKEGNAFLHSIWPILLYSVLFITSITFAKLSHFTPMGCALVVVNLAVGGLLLPFKVAIAMWATALVIHNWLPPTIYFWFTFAYDGITLELLLSVAIGLAALVGAAIYNYFRNTTYVELSIIKLARSYEQEAALAAIYHQANWARLDPTYSGEMLKKIGKILHSHLQTIHTEIDKQKLEEDLNDSVYKLNAFRKSLLQRAKETYTLELDPKTVQPVAIDTIIFNAYTNTHKLGEPVQILLRNQAKVSHLLADPAAFERLLTINLWAISQSAQTTEGMITLTLAATTLRYDYANSRPKGGITPSSPAVAFFISTTTISQDPLPTYNVTGAATPIYLPRTADKLYQVESKQIVEAHGGYVEIVETAERLTCLYVLPIEGKNVMKFKRYVPAVLLGKVAETTESIAQEKELIELLTTETTLTKKEVVQTITFIKNAHGHLTRKSGEPYYTHPMTVAKILLEITKDPTTLLAALLHDVVEDTTVTLQQLELLYGAEIAFIVDQVTHYNTHGYRWKLEESVNKSILDQCKDIRVVQVKLADRLHNTRTLYTRKPMDQKRIAKETLEFYIPWGEKNNILTWLKEMKDICRKILE